MFLITLERLMKERGLNRNTLSKQSGVPYTTIDGFYKKGYDNIKLSTLRQLSGFFNVSLDYLISGVSEEKRDIDIYYEKLNPLGKDMAKEYVRLLSLDKKYAALTQVPPEPDYETAAFGGKGTNAFPPKIKEKTTSKRRIIAARRKGDDYKK